MTSSEASWTRKAEQSATYLQSVVDGAPRAVAHSGNVLLGGGMEREGEGPSAPATPTGGPEDTENEDEELLRSRKPGKRARKSNSG